jgi:Tfp pilus assembly protein PilN
MTEASRVQKLLNEQNAEIDRLKNRIEKLEAALREIAEAVGDPSAYWIARKALDGKDDVD